MYLAVSWKGLVDFAQCVINNWLEILKIEMMMASLIPKIRPILLPASLLLFVAACAQTAITDFPVSAAEQADLALENVDIIRLTPQNIGVYGRRSLPSRPASTLETDTENWAYLVGVGDVLSVTVWDHPELTLPAGEQRSQVESGNPVKSDGSIFYPYIGNVRVAGRDVADIQRELSLRLAEFIPDPQVEVKVAAFNSQKAIITGQVAKPGALSITNIPLTLIEAITASGGLLDTANGREVRVTRAGHTDYVNLDALFSAGQMRNNPVLRGGDIINVPGRRNNIAYVLGQVLQPGAVDLGADGVSLTDALAQKGGLNETNANAQGIFVFRAKGREKFEVFQLDATTPLAFVLATNFSLHPQDVVYVVTDPVAKWNAVIAGLLPSITAIRGAQVIGRAN